MWFRPFKVAIEQLPFYNYSVRLIRFIKNPAIDTTTDISNNELRYAVLDIFSSLVLVSGIVALLGHLAYPSSVLHFDVLAVAHNFYAPLVFFCYALLYSIALTSVCGIIHWLKHRTRQHSLSAIFLLPFYHCLRFYAVVTILAVFLFIYGMNTLFIYGIPFFVETLLDAIITLSGAIVCLYLFFRILVKPIAQHFQLLRKRWLNLLATLVIACLAFEANLLLPDALSNKMAHTDKLCKQLSKAPFIQKQHLDQSFVFEHCINNTNGTN